MKKPFKPIVGRYCKQRNGEVVGPIRRSKDEDHPFAVGDLLFLQSGHFIDGCEFEFDLVSNLSAPRSRKKKLTMLTRWAYSRESVFVTTLSKGQAIKDRQQYQWSGYAVGPIVKIQIPAPVGGKKK